MRNIKKSIQSFYINKFSKKLSSRYLILESDDWGTIRMHSPEVYGKLVDAEFPVQLCPYTSFDGLETNTDMELLLEVLSSVKDANNHPAVLTANWIAANPDFERIRNAGFSEYFYESSVQTLQQYLNSERVHALQKEGLHAGIFYPQFHGREHVHVFPWLAALKQTDSIIRKAFDLNLISFNTSQVPGCEADYMDVYNAHNQLDLDMSIQSVKEGLQLFQHTWGFASKTAIAPCYYWHSRHEEVMHDLGVELLQGLLVQKYPLLNNGKWSKKYHHTGQSNRLKQKYSVRNVMLEPSLANGSDVVLGALKSTSKAFEANRPAIVSTHRLNYMGRISPENRDRGLKHLQDFLTAVMDKWPDAQFIHSARLSDILFGRA